MEYQEARTERTPEEVAWDEEFADSNRSAGVTSDLRGFLAFAARLPGALIQVPLSMMPEETARHARAAALESFLAARTLFSAIGDNIESALAGPGADTAGPTVKGPEGTWGTGRAAPTAKVKRIEVVDTAPGDMP